MNRRAFFAMLAGAALSAAEFDLERLLWVPGKKKIFIPPAPTPPEVHIWSVYIECSPDIAVGSYLKLYTRMVNLLESGNPSLPNDCKIVPCVSG